jgi:2-beta-glucuronyltransferase
MDPMGVEKSLFDVKTSTPFTDHWEKECICAGTTQFDYDAVILMAKLRPSWRFHILGRLTKPLIAENIVTYGEMPFSKIIPYLQYADIGLRHILVSLGLNTKPIIAIGFCSIYT